MKGVFPSHKLDIILWFFSDTKNNLVSLPKSFKPQKNLKKQEKSSKEYSYKYHR